MCVGSFAKCLGITLIPLSLVCVICNILLFFPGASIVDIDHITYEVWYFGGILGSGVLVSTYTKPTTLTRWHKHSALTGSCLTKNKGYALCNIMSIYHLKCFWIFRLYFFFFFPNCKISIIISVNHKIINARCDVTYSCLSDIYFFAWGKKRIYW